MLSEDFVIALTAKYKDRKNADRNKVFYDEITRFADICPENRLQEMYDYIPEFHIYSTPFDVWKLKKYAMDQGYIEKQKKQKDYVLFYRCKGFSQIREEKLETGKIIKHYDHIKCNTEYSFGSTGCPNCHSTSADLIQYRSTSLPESVLIVKEDCHKCKNYVLSHEVNLENNVHGPECSEYAKHPYPNSSCGDCKCKACCESFKHYSEDPRKYVDEIKRTGVDPMYWIGKNLVVSMHIRDETRLEAPIIKDLEYDRPQFFGVNIEELAKSKRVKWSINRPHSQEQEIT